MAVGVVLGGTGVWWLASGKNWFKGPKVQGTPEEMAAIAAELERVRAVAPAPTGAWAGRAAGRASASR